MMNNWSQKVKLLALFIFMMYNCAQENWAKPNPELLRNI